METTVPMRAMVRAYTSLTCCSHRLDQGVGDRPGESAHAVGRSRHPIDADILALDDLPVELLDHVAGILGRAVGDARLDDASVFDPDPDENVAVTRGTVALVIPIPVMLLGH